MDLIWEKFTEWLKELLVGGIMDNLTGLFDNVNAKVAEAAGHIGSTPQAWNANIYSMIRSLSDNLILPIAGVILAFVMTLELIQLIADRNNLHDIDTWVSCHYVDSIGFRELPNFLKPENYLKNVEMLLEDDYGMIDGIINNGPKQPTVADLEAQVKAGFSISLTELAAASHREQKKPSVLEKLREKTPEQSKNKTAPKRSAEREL